jgi:hypothetical protein
METEWVRLRSASTGEVRSWRMTAAERLSESAGGVVGEGFVAAGEFVAAGSAAGHCMESDVSRTMPTRDFSMRLS